MVIGGDPERECKKAPNCVKTYTSCLSGPMMERLDLAIDMPRLDIHQLTTYEHKAPESEKAREKVENAWHEQKNQKMSRCPRPQELEEFLSTNPQGRVLLTRAAENFRFSARNFYRTAHVARTISFLDHQGHFTVGAMAEALTYRFHGEHPLAC